jgi:general secretion pathway protein D
MHSSQGVRNMSHRRIALKATLPLLQAIVIAGLLLSGAPTSAQNAAPQNAAPPNARRASDDLLREARAAIKRSDYARAENLITDAEKLGVRYDPLTDRWSDTPDSLRKLLAQERGKANGTKSPFSMPALFGGKKPAEANIPTDPTAATSAPASQQTINGAADKIAGDQKSLAASYVKDARTAMGRGDKLAAVAAWQKAASIPATFGPQEDSPQRLADDLIRAGIDRSRLVPAASPAVAASPYALRPADVDQSQDRLPQLNASGAAPPAAAAPGNYSPYNLPPESNPLSQSQVSQAAYQQAPQTPSQQTPSQQTPSQQGPYQQAPQSQYQQVSQAAYEQPVQPAYQPTQPQEAQPQVQPQAQPQSAYAPQEPQRLPTGDANAPAEASRLVAQSRLALDRGDLATAASLAEQAEALNVPDTAFAPGETRPWQMSLEVSRAQVRREGVMPAGATGQAAEPRYPVAQGVYTPEADQTRLIPAATQQLMRAPPPVATEPTVAQRLYQEGLQALQAQDRATAMQRFSEAWRQQDQLDPETRQQLKDKLTFLRNSEGAKPLNAGESPSPLEQVNSQQELLRQKMVREILNEEKAAQQQAQTDPRGALANLRRLRERVAAAEVEPAARKQLLTMVDKLIKELDIYIEQNKAAIQSTEQNNAVKAEVVRDQEVRLQSQGKLADMVEQFNRLMDEKRYAEAEVIARQANDIAPGESVVVNMIEKSKLAHRIYEDLNIRDGSERYFAGQMLNVGRSAIGIDDNEPFAMPDAKTWTKLSMSRRGWLKEQRNMTPAEREIQKSLSKGVEVRFINRPLSEVMDTLGRMAGVNVYLDPQGLNAEGVTTDTPVTLNLTQPISFKSALNLMLSPLGLSYVIQNEVLRITSEQTKDSNVYAKAYYVADLVMPIPNFVNNGSLGLPGAIRESLNAMTGLGIMPRAPSGVVPLTISKDEGQQQQSQSSASVLAQINNLNGGGMGGLGGMGGGMRNAVNPAGGGFAGPGGLGRGAQPDFDSLTELITSTIAPQSWQEVGGPGAITGYENNLSLVVSQTQEVHEQIADLLEQLRRLQDLQVTIEVRFITLADNFFERIGVDFQLSIDDNTGLNNFLPFLPSGAPPTANSTLFDDSNKTVSIGWNGTTPTGDLDIKLSQGSFGGATPQFGNFNANTVANFGFAILSDLEVFFVLAAGQGDTRANILQAPKVTLFNGQFAFVSDTTQQPFVTTVIPVVGDFAAAQQPVIVVLNEGTSLSVQAVVSSDRRFVRLTMVPFFSQIGDVKEFTFTGTTTTDSGSTVQDPSNPDQNVTNNTTKTVSGTTVQLPTFAFTTVTTTVSVPDGGTVLLGGIKRLREGRSEFGVPILNKVPYISRLFKNVGIGREAQSLMMMVTPRIIIQEEEEQKLGIEVPEQ